MRLQLLSLQGKSDSRGDGEQLSHGEDERLGYIPDRKAGLKRCMKTRLCHPCGKMTSVFRRTCLVLVRIISAETDRLTAIHTPRFRQPKARA